MPAHPPCNRPVTILSGVQPSYPDSAKSLHLGTELVVTEVRVDAQGVVQSVRIRQSSGVDSMDRAALKAAAESTYAPAEKNCVPVAGTYIFRVTFDPYS